MPFQVTSLGPSLRWMSFASLPSICAGLMLSTKSTVLASRARRSAIVSSVSSYFGTSTPASRATAAFAQHVRIDLLRFGVGLRFFQDRGKILQHVGEARRACLVHRDGHGVAFRVAGTRILLPAGDASWHLTCFRECVVFNRRGECAAI